MSLYLFCISCLIKARGRMDYFFVNFVANLPISIFHERHSFFVIKIFNQLVTVLSGDLFSLRNMFGRKAKAVVVRSILCQKYCHRITTYIFSMRIESTSDYTKTGVSILSLNSNAASNRNERMRISTDLHWWTTYHCCTA